MLLHEKLQDYQLILASQSPRRRQLMEDCGLPFTLAGNYEAEEIYPDDIPTEKVPVYLSQLKSSAFPEPLEPNDILITADTVVLLGDEILGKPTDREDAIRILTKLSGRSHRVVTGVTFRSLSSTYSFDSVSEVFFRPLTREEIVYYVDNYRPFDKAGAYGIQEWIGYVGISRIEGSFYNVMGLPIQKLYEQLNQFIR